MAEMKKRKKPRRKVKKATPPPETGEMLDVSDMLGIGADPDERDTVSPTDETQIVPPPAKVKLSDRAEEVVPLKVLAGTEYYLLRRNKRRPDLVRVVETKDVHRLIRVQQVGHLDMELLSAVLFEGVKPGGLIRL